MTAFPIISDSFQRNTPAVYRAKDEAYHGKQRWLHTKYKLMIARGELQRGRPMTPALEAIILARDWS